MNNKMIIACLAFVALLLITDSTKAQITFGQKSSIQAGAVISSWKLSLEDGTKTTISQYWFHLGAYIPLKENFEARVNMLSLTNNLSDPIGKSNVSGLGDSRLILSHSFKDDRVLVKLGLNVPTGKQELDPISDRRIITWLSENSLDFPARRYGKGFGFDLLVGGVHNLGATNIGGSLSFISQGKFKPYKGVYEYSPGNIFEISIALDHKASPMKWSLRTAYRLNAVDKSNNIKTLKQSPTLNIRLSNVYLSDKTQITSSIGFLVRGDNTRYTGEEESFSIRLYGNETHISTKLMYTMSPKLQVGPSAYLRLIKSNDIKITEFTGKSHTLKLGVAGKIKTNRNQSLNIETRYLSGTAYGGQIDLSGIQIILSYFLVF